MATVNSISNRALLVNLQISQWTARKLDRSETLAVNAKHGLSVEAARVNKNLLPLATELERVHKTTAFIRKDFAKRTLPWGLEGVSILRADAYMDFTTVVRQWKSDWEGAVVDFITNYPVYHEEARLLLNGMFRDEDYPDVDDLARRFRFNIRFMPVPDKADWRVDVGDEAISELKASVERDVQEAVGAAMKEAWQRIHDLVAKAHERLANPANIFRDTLVDNAVELCALLPSLNITGDPKLEKMRQAVERSLCTHNPTTLRDDPLVRSQVADQMADIMKKMSGAYAQATA